MAVMSGSADFRYTVGITAMDFCVQWLESGNAPGLGGGADKAFEVEAGATIRFSGTMLMLNSGVPDNTGTMSVHISVYEDNGSTVALANTQLASRLDPVLGTEYTGSTTWVVPKAGTYRIRCRGVFSDTSSLNNFDGHSDSATPTTATGTWAAGTINRRNQGYIRSGISPTITVANISDYSVSPSTYAWPDNLFVRLATGFSAVDMSSTKRNMDVDILASDGTTEVYDSNILAPTASSNWTLDSSVALGTQLANGSFGIRVDQFDNSDLSGRPWVHIHTVPSGWTGGATDGGANTTKSVSLSRSDFSYNSTVTLTSLVNSEGTSTVYNRGESTPEFSNSTVLVRNARTESFTPRGTESFTVVNIGDNTEESVHTPTFQRNGSNPTVTHAWKVVFTSGTTGHSAPATTAGATKKLRWKDSATNSPTADSTQFGALSSLYDVAVHLQKNDNALVPGLNVAQRLTSDLGFISAKVTNRRGQGVNGVTGSLRLRDDKNLVSAIPYNSVVTATTNGNAGYIPLQIWDSALPGGGWDLYTSEDGGSAFALNNNTGPLTRKAANQSDFTLLAINPNYRVVSGLGVASVPVDGDHWHAGDDLLIGLVMVDFETGKYIEPDSSPAPRAMLGRFNNALSRGEFYDSDGAWKPLWSLGAAKTITGATNATPIVITTSTNHGYVTNDSVRIFGVTGNTAANATWHITYISDTTFSLDGSVGNGAYVSGGTAEKGTATAIYEWPLARASDPPYYGPDPRVFIKLFSGATTASWGDADLFLIGKAFVNGTPYTGPSFAEALSKIANAHDKYKFDGAGFVGFPKM